MSEPRVAPGSRMLELGYFAVLAFAFVAPGLLGAAVPAFRDFLVLVVPLRLFASRALATGEIPLWTDDLFLGAPFLANFQSAVFYPPSLFLHLPPEPAGLSWLLGFHLALAGCGMAAFLREVERLRGWSAAFGGTVYAAGGFFTSLLPLTNHLQAAAWLPWILLAGERVLDRGDRREFLALTLLFSMQILTGAPETVLLTGLLLSALLLRRAAAGQLSLSRVPSVGAAALLAVALCAVQLVPTLEYVGRSDRAEGLGFAAVAEESIEPRSLQQLVLPHTFTDGAPDLTAEGGVPLFWSIHLGAAGIIFAAAGASSPFWLGIIGVGVVLSLGASLPVLGAAYEVAPSLIGAFRYPGKFFVLAHLGLAVLAAHGVARTLASPLGSRRASIASLVTGALLVGVASTLWIEPAGALAALGFDLRVDARENVVAYLANGVAFTAVRFALFASIVGALLAVTARRVETPAWVGPLLILVVATDLVLLHRPILGFADWEDLAAERAPQRLGLDEGDRVFHYCRTGFGCAVGAGAGFGTWRGTLRVGVDVRDQAGALWRALVPDTPLLHDIGTVAGTDGVTTREQRELERALRVLPAAYGARLLAALGTTALIGREALPDVAASVVTDEGTVVTRLENSAPRTYLAERVFADDDLRSTLGRMADERFRAGKDAVVAGMERDDRLEPGSLDVLERRAQIHRYRVRSADGALLVENDAWYPGWVATIDGQATPLRRANGIVRAIEVPAGAHDVVIVYRPRSFRLGLFVTLVAGLAIAIAVRIHPPPRHFAVDKGVAKPSATPW